MTNIFDSDNSPLYKLIFYLALLIHTGVLCHAERI
jgi:hypothetical protein